jgi:hypothetical protein
MNKDMIDRLKCCRIIGHLTGTLKGIQLTGAVDDELVNIDYDDLISNLNFLYDYITKEFIDPTKPKGKKK